MEQLSVSPICVSDIKLKAGLEMYRILHLGKYYPPHPGGMETHVRDLAVRQARNSIVQVVVSNSKSRTERSKIEGVDVIRLARFATVSSMPVCFGISKLIQEFHADVVHLHGPNPLAAFEFVKSRCRSKLIITHHADTLGRHTLRMLSDPFMRRAMQTASAIIVTSERYLRTSPELAHFRDKCRIVPLGIDLHNEDKIDDCAEMVRVEFHKPIILAVGRLVPYKGFDVLIRALKELRATLVLIGEGPEEKRLCEIIEQEGVHEKVRMLGHVANLRPYFEVASVLVLPSVTRAEAFGLVQLEAMAAGITVINTNIDSGVPEVSVHGETGLTVEPGDVGGLASAIERLLNDGELRLKYGREARSRVLKEYSADLMAERTTKIYKEILSRAY